jgi:hypothetical protein
MRSVLRVLWQLPGWLLGVPLFVAGALCALLACILVVVSAFVLPLPGKVRHRATNKLAIAVFGLGRDDPRE